MLGKDKKTRRGLTFTFTVVLGLFTTTWAFVNIKPSSLMINPDPLLVVIGFPVKKSTLFYKAVDLAHALFYKYEIIQERHRLEVLLTCCYLWSRCTRQLARISPPHQLWNCICPCSDCRRTAATRSPERQASSKGPDSRSSAGRHFSSCTGHNQDPPPRRVQCRLGTSSSRCLRPFVRTVAVAVAAAAAAVDASRTSQRAGRQTRGSLVAVHASRSLSTERFVACATREKPSSNRDACRSNTSFECYLHGARTRCSNFRPIGRADAHEVRRRLADGHRRASTGRA